MAGIVLAIGAALDYLRIKAPDYPLSFAAPDPRARWQVNRTGAAHSSLPP